MMRTILTIALCATLLWPGAVLAVPTAQQSCDKARVSAWKTYVSCIETKLANDAGGGSFDALALYAKCRHTYFKTWTTLQRRTSLAGSTCIGARFTDNLDGTVTDNLSTLVWEQKTDDGDTLHDKNNIYSWSMGAPSLGSGSVFTTFIAGLNGAGFAGTSDWRLPSLAELQSIELDFPCLGVGGGATCSCPSAPCVEPALGPTRSSAYWCATNYLPNPDGALIVNAGGGDVGIDAKTNANCVRAVRAGLY